MKQLALAIVLLLLASPALAQNVTETGADHDFQVGDVVRGLTAGYGDKKGIVTNIDVNDIYVRWEGLNTAVRVDYTNLERTGGDPPPETFTAARGSPVSLEYNRVRAIVNDVAAYYGSGTCSDNIRNNGETDVDCGGPCPLCDTTPSRFLTAAVRADNTQASITGSLIDEDYALQEDVIDPSLNPVVYSSGSEDIIEQIVDAVHDSTAGVTAAVQDMKSSVQDMKNQQATIKANTEQVKSRVDAMNTNVNGVSDQVANLEQPMNAVQAQVGTLSTTSERGSIASFVTAGLTLMMFLIIGYLAYTVVALKKDLHEVTQTRPQDLKAIRDYANRMTSKGYSEGVIKQELAREGFSRATIDMALKQTK